MLKPSEIPVHGDKPTHLLFTDMFGISEAEFVAMLLVRALARKGDSWETPITLEDVWPDIEHSKLCAVGIIDPIRGRQRLLLDGYITVGENGIVAVTDAFIDAINARFAQP